MGWASRPSKKDGRDAHPTIKIKIVSYLIRDPKGGRGGAVLIDFGLARQVTAPKTRFLSLRTSTKETGFLLDQSVGTKYCRKKPGF